MKLRTGTGWFSWPRLAGAVVTVVLFTLIFQSLQPGLLWSTFHTLNPSRVLGAMILYGAVLCLGAMRWHLCLTATGCPVHIGASLRMLAIGHFYFVALFGSAGGDVAKSMLYARYFRRDLPEVLAAAPLDRAMGTMGALLVAGIAFGLAFGTDGAQELVPTRWDSVKRWWGVMAALVVLGVVVVLVCRPRTPNPWVRGWRAFGTGVRTMLHHPDLGRKALAVAILHQVALCAVFALNVSAVSSKALPWGEMAWTIPAITMLSCFPVSFAGAGVREVASINFLGLYGIPQEQAVAAAMLTLLVKVTWAVVGAVVWWREEALQGARAPDPPARSISVVIPALNEEGSLPDTLRSLKAIPEIGEIIVVDGESGDRTAGVAEGLGCRVLRASKASRGSQIRQGAAAAGGDVILMLHADTWLPPHAGKALMNCLRDATVVGGGFWKVFTDTPLLLIGSRFKCAVRFWGWKRIAGDQALFVRRRDLEAIGGVPNVPLMEEFELCRLLVRRGRLGLAGATVRTSARRFRRLGVLRTYLLMGRIHALYRIGTPLDELRRIYEQHARPGS